MQRDKHADRETNMQTERQTCRQRDKHGSRETGTQTERQT